MSNQGAQPIGAGPYQGASFPAGSRPDKPTRAELLERDRRRDDPLLREDLRWTGTVIDELRAAGIGNGNLERALAADTRLRRISEYATRWANHEDGPHDASLAEVAQLASDQSSRLWAEVLEVDPSARRVGTEVSMFYLDAQLGYVGVRTPMHARDARRA